MKYLTYVDIEPLCRPGGSELVAVNKKLSTLPNWLYNLWIEYMCPQEMGLHNIYTKIDLDAQLYNQCNQMGEHQQKLNTYP